MLTRLKLATHWFKASLTPTSEAWSVAGRTLFALWILLFISFLVINVLPHFSVGNLVGLIALFFLFALSSLVFLSLIAIASAMKPGFRAALFFVLPPLLFMLLLTWGVRGALAGAGAIVVSLVCLVGGIVALHKRVSSNAPRRAVAVFAIGVLGFAISAFALLRPVLDPNPARADYQPAGRSLALANPGKPGPYGVTYFTYGSGKDRLRPEFALGARFLTRSVDGARLDKLWSGPDGWLRTHHWGFDATALPLQGRVWMPSAESSGAPVGPCPLVLIVHGNYEMEVPSDTGYAYLGELLASQGFILVSVDENFLNGSLEDFLNPLTFRFGKENKLRGWLVLEHLAQWRNWNAEAGHPLFGKIDMNRIALIGHSRGGEAVAIANALNDLDRDPDDATATLNYHFNLRAIGAIAPADQQYLLRGHPTPMRDTNYFVIQGSMDGDVTSFVGAAQYARDDLTGVTKAFKASAYVKDANHTQFSTGWGRYDVWLPSRFLLDERPLLKPQEQQQVLKVYLSAFLQATLDGMDEYRPLFKDARYGAGWLPHVQVISNYADSDTTWLANYGEDLDPTTGTAPGVKISGENLSLWREHLVDLKSSELGIDAAELGWDDRFSQQRASYTIELGKAASHLRSTSSLVFSAAHAGSSSLPDRFAARRVSAERQPLDWTLVVTDASGTQARLPLSHDALLYPQIKGQIYRINALNGTATSEIVFRRFQFALSDFSAANSTLDPAHLKSIRFDFDRSPRGAIVLSDVGFATP